MPRHPYDNALTDTISGRFRDESNAHSFLRLGCGRVDPQQLPWFFSSAATGSGLGGDAELRTGGDGYCRSNICLAASSRAAFQNTRLHHRSRF